MGVTLIDRSAYRIELTDAGRVFAAEVGRILGEVRNAVLVAKRAARSAAGQVRVGFTAYASLNPDEVRTEVAHDLLAGHDGHAAADVNRGETLHQLNRDCKPWTLPYIRARASYNEQG
jgi:DNA-binding transcriptional LysR family regulator